MKLIKLATIGTPESPSADFLYDCERTVLILTGDAGCAIYHDSKSKAIPNPVCCNLSLAELMARISLAKAET